MMFQSMRELFTRLLEEQPLSEEAIFLKGKISLHCFPKNQIIFYQQDENQKLYLLKEGLVVLNHYNDQGELTYHDVALPHILFPMTSLYANENNVYDAIAFTKVVLWQIKRTDLVLFFKRFPQYYPVLFRDFCKINQRLERRLYNLTSVNAKERILLIIKQLMLDFGVDKGQQRVLPWPITVVELSHLAKLTRETSSLVLNELKAEGKVSYQNKKLAIPL